MIIQISSFDKRKWRRLVHVINLYFCKYYIRDHEYYTNTYIYGSTNTKQT